MKAPAWSNFFFFRNAKGHASLRDFWAHSGARALVVERGRLENEDAHNHAHERALF